MSTTKRANGGSRRGISKRRGNGNVIGLRSITNSFEVRKTLRFIAEGAFDYQLDCDHFRNLLGMGYHSALPANGFYTWADTFKVHRIQMEYVDVSSAAAPAQISLEWATSGYGKSNRLSAMSIGMKPARIVSTPPAGTAASFWNYSGSNKIVAMSCPANTIIDVDISFVLFDNTGLYGATIQTMSDARFYMKYLDSHIGSTTGVLKPVGWPNVVNA